MTRRAPSSSSQATVHWLTAFSGMSATKGICRSAQNVTPPRLRTKRPSGLASAILWKMDLLARLLDPRRRQEDLRALFAGHPHGAAAALQFGKIADDARHAQVEKLLDVLQFAAEDVPDWEGWERGEGRTASGAHRPRHRRSRALLGDLCPLTRLHSGRGSNRGAGRWTAAASSRRIISCRNWPSTLKGAIGRPSIRASNSRSSYTLAPRRPNCSRSTSAVSGCRWASSNSFSDSTQHSAPVPDRAITRSLLPDGRLDGHVQRHAPPRGAIGKRLPQAAVDLRVVGLPDFLPRPQAVEFQRVAAEGQFHLPALRPP